MSPVVASLPGTSPGDELQPASAARGSRNRERMDCLRITNRNLAAPPDSLSLTRLKPPEAPFGRPGGSRVLPRNATLPAARRLPTDQRVRAISEHSPSDDRPSQLIV